MKVTVDLSVLGKTKWYEYAVRAAGATIGTVGLLCFALLVWQLITSYQTWIVLTAATFAWLTVSVLIWHLRK